MATDTDDVYKYYATPAVPPSTPAEEFSPIRMIKERDNSARVKMDMNVQQEQQQQQQAPNSAEALVNCICCKVHIAKLASGISVFMIAISALALLGAMMDTRQRTDQAGKDKEFSGAIALIMILLHAGVIAAQRKRDPDLYLPYLIVAGIVLVTLILGTIIFTAVLIINSQEFGVGDDFIVLFMVFYTVYICVFLLVYAIIFRAWQVLKKEKLFGLNTECALQNAITNSEQGVTIPTGANA